MHTGSGASMNPKLWPCEDSLCPHALEDGFPLAVADAHWGGSSSEAVTGKLKAAWLAASGAPLERLRSALLDVEGRFFETRDVRDGSETTVLLVHVAGNILSYLSVGDSLLAVGTAPALSIRNRPQGYFLGQFPVSQVASAVELGQFKLQPGELVLLATDGLEPEASGLQIEDVGALLATEGSLEERLQRLMQRASDPQQGGGRDNLALVLLAT